MYAKMVWGAMLILFLALDEEIDTTLVPNTCTKYETTVTSTLT